jgi:hypothetical protein
MALDLGTAIANIGQTWNSALQNKKARETQEKQQFIDNLLRQDQLRLQQDSSARAADKQTFDQQMDLAENYGGKQLPVAQAEQIFTHPKLRELVMQRLQPRLASTSLAGVGTGMQQGETPMGSQMAAPSVGVSMEKSAPIAEGMAEIQTPMSSGMRIADMQTQAANARSLQNAELRTSLAEYNAQQQSERQTERLKQQEELANARMQLMATLAGQRGDKRTTKFVETTDETGKRVRMLIDSETGDVVKSYDAPPTQAKNNMAGAISELEAVNKMITDAETLGTKIKWRGTGPLESRIMTKLSALPGVGQKFTDPEAEELRQAISNVGARVRHELYGAALTGGEREQAEKFIKQIEANPVQIATSLAGLKKFNATKLGQMRPAGGMGGSPTPAGNAPASGGPRVRVIQDANGNFVDAATGKPIQ